MHDEPVMPMKIAIFGTDSLLAAHPVNWVQLTHACRKAGFDFLVPVSWGEELIAAHVGRQMADSATTSVMSSCPLVAQRLRGFPVEVSVLNTVPPPVACARYVRAVFHPRPVHVTYVGGCPGAASEDVDVHVDADVFFDRLAAVGIDPHSQPHYFEDQVPVDRARYASTPGGAPDVDWLLATTGVPLIEAAPITIDAVAKANSDLPVLMDLSVACGCACARDRFRAARLEPARATAPVVGGEEVSVTDAPTAPPTTHEDAPDPETLSPVAIDLRAMYSAHGLSEGEPSILPDDDSGLVSAREPW